MSLLCLVSFQSRLLCWESQCCLFRNAALRDWATRRRFWQGCYKQKADETDNHLMNGPFSQSSMKYFSGPLRESLIQSFCQRGKNWVISYRMTQTIQSHLPKRDGLVTTKMHILTEIRTRRWFCGVKRNFQAAGGYCSFLVLAKWLKFSAHSAFPFVSLFAQNRSRERRKGLGAREITAICQMRNTTMRRANTTRNTITKLSLERKRNLSISWLPRNPNKG